MKGRDWRLLFQKIPGTESAAGCWKSSGQLSPTSSVHPDPQNAKGSRWRLDNYLRCAAARWRRRVRQTPERKWEAMAALRKRRSGTSRNPPKYQRMCLVVGGIFTSQSGYFTLNFKPRTRAAPRSLLALVGSIRPYLVGSPVLPSGIRKPMPAPARKPGPASAPAFRD